MKNFLMLNTFISIWIIRVLYWIGQIGIIVMVFVGGNQMAQFGIDLGFVGSLIYLIVASFGLRVMCEMLIVTFAIADNTSHLKDVANK